MHRVNALPAARAAERLLRVGERVCLEMVQLHRVEPQRAPVAVDLHAEFVIGARGDLRRLHHAHAAVGDSRQDGHRVLRLNRDHLPFLIRPLRVEDATLRLDFCDGSNEPIHEVEDVACKIVDDPAARDGQLLPAHRLFGVNAARVIVAGAELRDATDKAFRYHLLRAHGGRGETIIQRHLADARTVRKRRRDLFRVGQRARERLVAVDMLARPDGREELVLVKVIGRANVDDVHVLAGHDVGDVRRRHLESAVALRPLRRFRARRADRHQPYACGRRIIKERQTAVGEGVNLADETISENCNANLIHSIPLPKAAKPRSKASHAKPLRRKEKSNWGRGFNFELPDARGQVPFVSAIHAFHTQRDRAAPMQENYAVCTTTGQGKSGRGHATWPTNSHFSPQTARNRPLGNASCTETITEKTPRQSANDFPANHANARE